MYHQIRLTITRTKSQEIGGKEHKMSLIAKRTITLAIVIVVAALFGRLAVREFLNLLPGGTLFGGNFL